MHNPRIESPFCTEYRMAAILHDCRFSGGMSASGQSAGFGGNLFTRDTLRVLRDIMNVPGFEPFVREMLSVLPQWQGVKEDPATNEFPDAMPHQVFRQFVGGRMLPIERVEHARHWTERWGVSMTTDRQDGDRFVIYNSSDAPLLYVVTLGEYCQRYGKAILHDTFRHQLTDRNRQIGEAALRCVNYIARTIEQDEVFGGLYAVPNTNPKQTSPSGVMRDGFGAYVRADGRTADYGLMAYVENQALACQALLLASNVLFPNHEDVPRWKRVARQLRARSLEQFWMEGRQFFAAALDRNGQVDMVSSAVFELLDGPFFDGLDDAPDYVRTLLTELCGVRFMTPAGVRMTSLEHVNNEGKYWPYQGTRAVWGVTNGIVPSGLLNWKLGDIACNLGHGRFISSLNRAEQALEMMYVDDKTGMPLYQPKEVDKEGQFYAKRIAYPAEIGQRDQAWTASAVLRLLRTDCQKAQPPGGSWQAALNKEMALRLSQIPTADQVPLSEWHVDLVRGKELKKQRAQALGLTA